MTMYGNESLTADEDCPIGPILATPSKVAERQKQQRTLEYLLKMNRHKRSDKVLPEDLFDTETNHVSISNSENDVISSKVLNTLCQEHDKSGDWKDNEAWKVQGHVQPKVPSCKISTADWKCRNLYSMSNSHRYSGWNTGYADVTESLQEELAKDREQNLLFNIRDYLAGYQETHGTPRTEYSFAALISVMGQTTGRALLALFYIIVNIAPVAEVFLYILRFVLDKVINIIYTPDKQQILVKYLVLGLQLLTIYICLMFIFGFIITPIIYMVIEILTKIMLLS
ncbi:uncharacterized protein LOC124184236 [Neodiprion fabricii]|uniref:uncharacterized protein LOC124184236 n=1 Tax=Neodiprion fabricii TaxID=2872261 RepID=UPI001ED8CA6D|nr:uncharacterized protein LOC124184236 [Neodiprion fabricii]